jgi:hypothetical protein
MRTRITVLACAGLMATPAVADSGGRLLQGQDEPGPPVTFKVSHGKVKKFVGGVNVLCLGGYGIEFRAAIPPTAMKLRHGTFSYKGRDASDEANIKIKGELTGKKSQERSR